MIEFEPLQAYIISSCNDDIPVSNRKTSTPHTVYILLLEKCYKFAIIFFDGLFSWNIADRFLLMYY